MQYPNLYIHVPFCIRKCGYCAFYSVQTDSNAPIIQWQDKISQQIIQHAPELQNLKTIYFGGGTPSILPPAVLRNIFDTIKQHCNFQTDPEISMEANPETVTPELADTAAGFINRISMGVQSFNPILRKAVGRHTATADAAINAVKLWKSAGIGNLGLDLLYALPGETLADFQHDLELAVSLPIRHLSCYSIIPEEGTPFYQTGYEPDDDLSADMWELAGEFLACHDMPRYEISNYAAPEFRAKHNWNVWHGEPYLGLGPSAASFDGTDRWTEVPSIEDWLTDTPPEMDHIERNIRLREIFLMGLRTVDGWTPMQFETATGSKADFPEIQSLLKQGWLETDHGSIRPTMQGLTYWNEIGMELLNV